MAKREQKALRQFAKATGYYRQLKTHLVYGRMSLRIS